jgi:ABC-2 type transport system permease protein
VTTTPAPVTSAPARPRVRPRAAGRTRSTPLAAFVIKEVRHILRDRQTLAILLLMPLVQVVRFGFALRSDVRDIRLAVVDPSPDHATLALRNRFIGTGRFRVVADAPSGGVQEPRVPRGRADAPLV